MSRDPLPILQSTFGFPEFRGVQRQVVDRVLAGANTLAVMPTGAGKSLWYQLPAVTLDGCCVVFSPLIALMHDQLRAAEAIGIRAATFSSGDTNQMETVRRFRDGRLDLLYVAPERASGSSFRDLLASAPLCLFAIDEAHCVSEWGHDFRPDYRLLRPLLDRFPDVPRLALTATADAHTRADILEQLGIPKDGLIVAGFDRPNIRYAISPKDNTTRQIADLIAEAPGPGIVYAQTRAAPEKLAEALGKTGRPGRDGDPAVAQLFWGAEDFAKARQRIGEGESTRQPGERARLNARGALVETAGCRRKLLLAHFGEDAPDTCGNCDNCLNPPAAIDASRVAQKYLSAVFRTGQMFGAGYVESILTGQSSERSLMNGHEALSVFGSVDGEEAALLKPVGRALLLKDALRANPHGGLEFGPAAKALLKGEADLPLVLPPRRERRRRGTATGGANPIGDPLFEALRDKRRDLAQEGRKPPYVIFHDSVLRDMAAMRPASLAQLGTISGVGERKLEAYGEAFLQVIRQN